MKNLSTKALLHYIIIINFIIGLLYAAVKVFTTPKTEMLTRRLYAYESWIIIGFFAIYLAVTFINKKNN